MTKLLAERMNRAKIQITAFRGNDASAVAAVEIRQRPSEPMPLDVVNYWYTFLMSSFVEGDHEVFNRALGCDKCELRMAEKAKLPNTFDVKNGDTYVYVATVCPALKAKAIQLEKNKTRRADGRDQLVAQASCFSAHNFETTPATR